MDKKQKFWDPVFSFFFSVFFVESFEWRTRHPVSCHPVSKWKSWIAAALKGRGKARQWEIKGFTTLPERIAPQFLETGWHFLETGWHFLETGWHFRPPLPRPSLPNPFARTARAGRKAGTRRDQNIKEIANRRNTWPTNNLMKHFHGDIGFGGHYFVQKMNSWWPFGQPENLVMGAENLVMGAGNLVMKADSLFCGHFRSIRC